MRQVYALYPYENQLVVVEVDGARLKAVLEQAASYYGTAEWRDGRLVVTPLAGMTPYNFDVLQGATYRIDPTAPVGNRVKELRFKGRDVKDERPLQPRRQQLPGAGRGRLHGAEGGEGASDLQRRGPRAPRREAEEGRDDPAGDGPELGPGAGDGLGPASAARSPRRSRPLPRRLDRPPLPGAVPRGREKAPSARRGLDGGLACRRARELSSTGRRKGRRRPRLRSSCPA